MKSSTVTPRFIRRTRAGAALVLLVAIAGAAATLSACGNDPKSTSSDLAEDVQEIADDTTDATDPAVDEETVTPPVEVFFDLDGPRDSVATFFDFPFPSDLNANDRGGPDFRGIDNPKNLGPLEGLAESGADLDGFPALPVAWFRFTGPVAEQDPQVVIAAAVESPLLLVDIDADSPERGRLYPVIAHNLRRDTYTATNVLAVAPRQGFVLKPARTYAFLVRTSLGDAEGRPLAVNATFAGLVSGQADGPRGAEALALHAPLWDTLELLAIDPHELAAATVFTTANAVAAMAAMGDGVVDRYDVTIDNLSIDPDDGLDHAFFCELHGELTVPR